MVTANKRNKATFKRITSFILTAIMIFGVLTIMPNTEMKVSAENTNYNGFIAPIDPIPDGVNVKHISTAEDLAQIGGTGSKNNYYVLDNDIDLKDYGEWTPIVDFGGIFDGRGHTIHNLTITQLSYKRTNGYYCIGLFATTTVNGTSLKPTNSIIKNLAVNINKFSLEITNNNTGFTVEIGGIVGYVSNSDIINCYVTGQNINIESVGNTNGPSYTIGGLLGNVPGSASITNCYSTIDINVNSNFNSKIGGLIGESYSPVINCFTTGNIYNRYSGQYIGGLIGNALNTVSNCYATGNVTSIDGFAVYAGGLVGATGTRNIENCYATGNVVASSVSSVCQAGGISGSSSGSMINCYALGDVSSVLINYPNHNQFKSNAGGLSGRPLTVCG